MVKKIYVATKVRGFLLDLFTNPDIDAEFLWHKDSVYEINSNLKLLLSKIAKSRLGDYLGLIQRITVAVDNCDLVFSYNRFLKTEQKYVIYLENPTALFHYCLNRNATYLGKKKINKYLNDPKLQSIVCMSRACYETLDNFYHIPDSVNVQQIYPLVNSNPYTSIQTIKEKSNRDVIKCLYVSADFHLKGGREILTAFKALRAKGVDNIHLDIITKKEWLPRQVVEDLGKLKGVRVNDFNYTKADLQKTYSDSNVLLNPTRQDSFPLVVLEAMKAGNVVLATDLYAIPEMVVDGYNGYLTSPRYRFYNYDNLPNKLVWNNRKNTIYSDYVDGKIVEFLIDKLLYLNDRRYILEELAINSFVKANNKEYSNNAIINQWGHLFKSI